jgi:hypothetical protein
MTCSVTRRGKENGRIEALTSFDTGSFKEEDVDVVMSISDSPQKRRFFLFSPSVNENGRSPILSPSLIFRRPLLLYVKPLPPKGGVSGKDDSIKVLLPPPYEEEEEEEEEFKDVDDNDDVNLKKTFCLLLLTSPSAAIPAKVEEEEDEEEFSSPCRSIVVPSMSTLG